MTSLGIILIVIGTIANVLGIGGSAKLELEGLGVVLSAGAGVVLIVLGVIFLGAGI